MIEVAERFRTAAGRMRGCPMSNSASSPNGAPGRPAAALAIMPSVLHEIFPADVLARIRHSADLDESAILTDFSPDGAWPAAAPRALSGAEILFTGWGCPWIDASVLDAAPRLRAVIHAAGTVRYHVTPAVFDRGIAVSSAAFANARPVAEFTVAMLVLGMKQVFRQAAAYRSGGPEANHIDSARDGLAGSVVGLVGASRVGRQVIELLHGYGAHILLSDPTLAHDRIRALGAEPCDLDALCARADAVSIHAPELPATYHLIDDRRLGLMRDGALLLNTARGSLVDTEALTRHCAAGRISAVLDVTDPEPLPAGHPLFALPNVLLTPHLAGARGRELRRLGEYAARELEHFLHGEPLQGLVHLADLDRVA